VVVKSTDSGRNGKRKEKWLGNIKLDKVEVQPRPLRQTGLRKVDCNTLLTRKIILNLLRKEKQNLERSGATQL
jgi:hypothetical protein